MIIYHGSKIAVKNPKIIIDKSYKDFGYGFYCTNNKGQAERWARTKSKINGVVSIYDFELNKSLNVKKFNSTNLEWLNFIAECRAGIEHNYDIVEGPMADDTIWNFVQSYLNGDISQAAFLEIAKFKHPTHQITFCSNEALNCISFLRSYQLL